MKIIKNAAGIMVFLFIVSCCKDERVQCNGCDLPNLQLYKLRGDYTMNVCVVMDKNKTRIIGTPSPGDPAGTIGLYEIRVESGNSIYRIFSFFDKGNIIVLGNALRKKTQKTPRQEIEKALKIMEEYRNENS